MLVYVGIWPVMIYYLLDPYGLADLLSESLPRRPEFSDLRSRFQANGGVVFTVASQVKLDPL